MYTLHFMLKLTVIFLFFIYNSFSLAWSVRILSDDDVRDFYILDSKIVHAGSDASIQQVTDGIHIYILKQINNPSFDEQFLLINDVIASTIGSDAGINVNEVSLIPYTVATHLKIYPNKAATLHTLVPGKHLEQGLQHNFSDDFTIHQQSRDAQSIWQQKWPVSAWQQGLTKAIIESMSLHEDLPPIVALDTFVGNIDRSLPNIFYDKHYNHLYGIDQAAVFGTNLPQFAHDRIKELLEEGYFTTCDSRIIYGLHIYKKFLGELLEKNTPLMIIQSMQELTPYLGLNACINDNLSRMYYQAGVIKEAYSASIELMSTLDQI